MPDEQVDEYCGIGWIDQTKWYTVPCNDGKDFKVIYEGQERMGEGVLQGRESPEKTSVVDCISSSALPWVFDTNSFSN